MQGLDIPYGPEQKPWIETVAQVAMVGGKPVVKPPFKDPKKAYNYHGKEKEVTLKRYQVPSIGLNADQAREAQDETFNISDKQTQNFLGYQICLKNDYSTVAKYLTTMLNNIGDPFYPGAFVLNTKWMERNVLDYYASLWHAKWPHDPHDPETYWGYITTMGSSECNLYAMWNARDYLQGKMMMTDKRNKKLTVTYVQAKAPPESHMFTPISFYSEDTHYSVIKAMEVLEIKTFYEVGTEVYPNENPLNPGKEWPFEVPSLNGDSGPGSIDIDKLCMLVDFFASKGYPCLVCFNYGTTFKGAYDDVKKGGKRLMEIFEKYGLLEREITIQNPNHKDKPIKVTRRGYWIHVDGALGASYMPFLQMAYDQKKTGVKPGPIFDFRLPFVCSINTSGHKWPGAPWPLGIYMTKTCFQLWPPSNPAYIGSPDTTFAGSRNGLSALVWWTYISEHSYDSQVKGVLECLSMVEYACQKLEDLQKKIEKPDIWLAHTPKTLSIRFRKPKDEIVYKYTLAVETLNYNGEQRTYIHAYMMCHVTRKLIDDLVEDLSAPDAFPTDEDDDTMRLFDLTETTVNDPKACLYKGLVIGENNEGVEKEVKKLLHWPVGGRGFL